MAFASFTTATTFLEHASALDFLTYTVTTSSPASTEPEPIPALAQPDHALSSSTFFPADPSTAGFILSRIIEDGYTLELRWISFIHGEAGDGRGAAGESSRFAELDQQATLPPVRFVFPARLVPSPFFQLVEETGALQVLVLTEAGYLYALTFGGANLFYSPALAEEDWSEEYEVVALETRVPVLLQGVDDSRVIVGCEDGYIVSVEIEEGGEGTLLETELRSASSFSVRSLIPSFSNRNLSSSAYSSSASASSPSQLLSIASSISEEGLTTCAFGVTRDRKLKIWNVDSGVCLKAIDLPRPSSASAAMELELARNREMDSPGGSTSRIKGASLLPPSPQPFVKVIPGDDESAFPSYLVLFVPASSGSLSAFCIFGIRTGDGGVVNELTPVGERICGSSGAALVDFEVSSFGPSGNPGTEGREWTLWSIWQDGGELEMRYVGLPELADGSGIDDEPEWRTVDRGSAGVALWNAGYFDELLRDNPKGVNEVFVEHIFHPARYPPATLEHALATYEDALLNETDPHDRPEALELDYDSSYERVCAVVGCTVELETSAQTGALLYDAYNKRLKVEWLRFVAMCNESRAVALFPTALAVCPERQVALVVMRDAIAVPILQDTVLTLQQLVSPETNANEAQAFLNLPPEVLELSYPHLAPRGIRHDIVGVLRTIELLSSEMSLSAARRLEDELLARARAPFTHSTEETAIEIYERALEPHVGDELQERLSDELRTLVTPEASFQALWTLLTTADLVQPIRHPAPVSPISDLSAALLTESLSASIEARYSLALGLVTLLLYVYGEEGDLIPHIASLTSASFATLHTLASLRWLTQQATSPPPSTPSDDAILERFGDMKVSAADAPQPSLSFSLLNALVRQDYIPSLSTLQPLPHALTSAMCAFLTSTGLITQKRLLVDSPADVQFGRRLQKLGLPELAVEFVDMYPRGPGMLFVLGLAYLDLGRTDEAQSAFAKAAPALYSNQRLDQESGISHVLPVDIAGSLGRYYRHVVSLFVEHGIDLAVVKFAGLSLDSFAEERMEDEVILKDLWLKLFKSNASLGLYEDAYNTLMMVPYNDTKSTCLAHLISCLCENGQIDLLTRWSFIGLQSELERNLSFRARNSDPLALPNYYQILYAYHIAKGDYRSAGATMFQQGRRTGELSGRTGAFRELATLQCQSYLAAANALSLVEPKHAWVAVIAEEDASERTTKRRKLTYHIPEDEFDSLTRAAEIVDLADIRREYTVALSRLQLAGDFPELERSNFSLDPQAIVALFSQTAAFDSAFTSARTLGVDMSSLFEILTEKCVGLALHGAASDEASWVALNDEAATWEGSLASKAWRLLQRHLERHDGESFQYRLVVLERTLAVNRGGKVPSWLVDSFLSHESSLLIRTMIKFDRLADAFRYSLATIKAAPPPTAPGTSWLPFGLFDQLLAISASDSPALPAGELSSNQEELRRAVDVRLAVLEKAARSAVRVGR